jgi:hypothetical protein
MTSINRGSDDRSSDDSWQLFICEWLEFESELGEGSDGSEELYELLFNTLIKKCSNCHSTKVERIKETRYVRCVECGHKDSLTAGTFFHNVRRPKALLGAIRLMERGVEFNARMLALVANVAYASAWEMLKRIDEVLKKNLDSQALLLPSKIFEKMFIKRSRETPAREHPRDEQRIAEKEQRQELPANTANCSERDHQILAVIGEQVVDFDFICEQLNLPAGMISADLIMLELAKLIERLDGDRYRRRFVANPFVKPGKHAKGLVKKFIKYLKRSKRGISRKYLHLYMARFWCLIDRDRWKEGALLKECLHSHHLPRIVLTLENAPLMVQMPQPAA